RTTVQKAREVGLISEEAQQILVKALVDRNTTSHIYKEETAQEIANRVPAYYACMKQIVDTIDMSQL
ncbi:MAG TPA: nucleotidyltransferase substrate binding protein, partial [Candidatus Bathyarchaeia archaeon]|nr:nucleotidyltransferase substrate binding protein [Candidatus Bathyarchaeia archaeon]